jgi:tRNA-specific 2-thiouridylase
VREARVDGVRWTGIAPPDAPRGAEVVLRYRATPVLATVAPDGPGAARIGFQEPAWPVTPGQAAVFYEGEVVLGGGRIRPAP